MRGLFFVLALATGGFSLTAQDVLGTWRTEDWDGPGSVMEIWFGEDGQRELRSAATYDGIGDYQLHILGTWKISGESVVEVTTGGWTSFGGDLGPIEPDDNETSSKAEPVAGAPRKLKITDCDGPSLCTTREYTFVAATKEFTLPDLGAVTTTRRWTSRAKFKVAGSGRPGLGFRFDRRAFDLRGRTLNFSAPTGR